VIVISRIRFVGVAMTVASLSVVLWGGAPWAEEEKPPPPTPRPLGGDLPSFHAPEPGSDAEPQPLVEPKGVLVMRDALAIALLQNPDLPAGSCPAPAAEAEVISARLRPNPAFAVDVEDFGGTGESSGMDAAEITLSLGQVLELGGKRGARESEARLARDLAAWDYEAVRVEVLARTAADFVDVLAAQGELALSDEIVRLSGEIVTTVSERVKRARSHEAEATRARVALASAQIDQASARRSLRAARQRLAANWGSTAPLFDRAEGDLDLLANVPTLEEIYEQLPESPVLARWATENARREAALRRERAYAKPDLTLSAGLRRKNETDENVGVAGASVGLPFFNRNQGAIEAARAELAGAESERRSAESAAHAAVALSYQELDAARAEVTAFETEVLPGAEEAFVTISAGYEEGRFSYIEVLDAQRTLFDARTQRLRAQSRFHSSVIAIESVTGVPIAEARR
jgi:cobalt-zinc-cadmium efflux system outer membrane protein